MFAPLALDGVVHLVRPSGLEARDLAELREGIASASPESLFYHVHHTRLRHPFADSLPPDDFSAWAGGVVQDRATAERLALAAQTAGGSATALREALLAAIPGAGGAPAAGAPQDGAFTFLEMESVRVDLGLRARDATDLMRHLGEGNLGLYFHHVIERPWFDPALSLAGWVREQGEVRLADWIEESAHDGRPLDESRRRLTRRWLRSSFVHRIAEASGRPEGVRQAEARRVVSGLVRRLTEG